jgi:hypothetical protein
MASKVKQSGEWAVAEKALPTDYNRDFYSWLIEQAQHVRPLGLGNYDLAPPLPNKSPSVPEAP